MLILNVGKEERVGVQVYIFFKKKHPLKIVLFRDSHKFLLHVGFLFKINLYTIDGEN